MPETSSKLTHDDVRAIADLARLELSDDEVAMYASQLSEILDYFTLLQEVDTSHIAATASVLPFTNIMREDTVEPPLTPEEALANAPASDADQFRVLAVLDGGE